MELAERLRKKLKEYGIENDADLIEAMKQPGIDLGIFVAEQEGDTKSA